MQVVEGKCGIKVAVLCHSINEQGDRIISYECEYPRIIHSELLTHGMLSRNSASSRAIPAAKMREQLTARPVRFGKNVSGMQDLGEDYSAPVVSPLTGYELPPDFAWELARDHAAAWSRAFAEAGYHKQVFNRMTETYQMMKTVITATEFENFFWLRNHGAADPTLHELARCMHEAREKSTPVLLKAGEWHLPYVAMEFAFVGEHPDDHTPYNMIPHWEQMFFIDEEKTQPISLEDAIKVSAARCAAVSYRNVDYGLQKCREVHARLVGDERKHASAMEHQATPMQPRHFCNGINVPDMRNTWEEGISHMDRDGNLWSGKFKGFIQYRKLITGENYTGS